MMYLLQAGLDQGDTNILGLFDEIPKAIERGQEEMRRDWNWLAIYVLPVNQLCPNCQQNPVWTWANGRENRFNYYIEWYADDGFFGTNGYAHYLEAEEGKRELERQGLRTTLQVEKT